jgi:hypothetical protein
LSDSKSKKLPLVSIIILNYNGKKFIDDCLASILKINYPRDLFEIIFVDNVSTDRSVEYVTEKYDWMKILKLDKNYGYAGGNNRGAKIAKGEFIVFLNNDTIVDKNWLNMLVEVSLMDPKIGLCGSKIISMRDRTTLQYSGFLLHFLGGVVPSKSISYKTKSGNKFEVVGSVQGASFLAKKAVFEEIQGFDDDYFLYSEEIDLSNRIWINDYYVAYAPDSIVYHYDGGSSTQSTEFQSNKMNKRLRSPLRIYYGNRNSIMNIIKNFEVKNMIKGLIFSYFYFLIQILILLRKKDLKNMKLLFNAYIWPITHLKEIRTKRLRIQGNRKVKDEELINNKILLTLSKLLRVGKL